MLSTNYTSLAAFVRDTLFANWKRDREELRAKWERNRSAYLGESTGVWKAGEGDGWRSRIFIPATKQKISTAWTTICDTMLQGGRLPFSLVPASYDRAAWNDIPFDDRGQAQAAIDAQSALIQRQLADCNSDRQLMSVILSAAIYGEAYAKFFVGEKQGTIYRNTEATNPNGARFFKVQLITDTPSWEYVPIWDIYRDLESFDLQRGVGVIHRQMASSWDLRQWGNRSGYLADGIERAIAEATKTQTLSQSDTSELFPALREITHRNKTIDVLEFWGRVPAKIVREFEASAEGVDQSSMDFNDNDGNEIEITATVAGTEIIRFARWQANERPFFRIVWEQKLDHSGGFGLADNIEGLQQLLNGSFRAFEDNKKLTGNVVLGVKERYIGHWDGEIRPGLKIDISEECDDVRKAIQPINFSDVGESLLNLIGLLERYVDEASHIPKILQGSVMPKQQVDTATELKQLQENSGKYLGSVIRNVDEGLIEPLIKWFYEWNMDDPLSAAPKGSWEVQATGFNSFQNRGDKLAKMLQLLQLVQANEQLFSRINVDNLLAEITKGMDLDKDQLLLGGEFVAQAAQQDQGGGIDAAMAEADIAKKRAEAELALARAEKERIDAGVRQAGVDFDSQKLKIEKARAVSDFDFRQQQDKVNKAKAVMDMENSRDRFSGAGLYTPDYRATPQGPYVEKGLLSNNETA